MIENPGHLAERLMNENLEERVLQTHHCGDIPCCQFFLMRSHEEVHDQAVKRLFAEGRLETCGDALGLVDGTSQTWRLVR
jgi:hypothetical protein